VSIVAINRVALPVLAVTALVAVGAIPAVRVWRRTGVWPVTIHRAAHPLQRWTAGWLVLLLAAFTAWIALYSWRGPAWLGVWAAPAPLLAAGWLVALGGLALTSLGQRHLGESWRIGIDDRPTALVTGGVYRVIRNPIFAGAIVMLAGVALVVPCPWTLMGCLACVALFGVQARAEEQHLLRCHGDRYRTYASSVGRFLPGLGRLFRGDYPERDEEQGDEDRR
jgi:protein-S-isoprenylcysteine O-methyltransferase Ste14